MKIKVFISKGSVATIQQREFIDGVLDTLKTVGLSPRVMNENEWSHEQPLQAIKKVIKECKGAVIIAFSRTIFKEGIELRDGGNRELKEIALPTPWNHIEAAMAYSFDLPLLVVAENGLKPEGLIEQDYDWSVYWTDLNSQTVKSDKFKGFLLSWKRSVENFNTNEKKNVIEPEKLKVGELIKSLTVVQAWKIAVALIAFLSTIIFIAFKAGSGKFPWQ